MTNEEVFQTLLQWASAFGYYIIVANEEAFPEDKKEARGIFYEEKREGGGGEICLKCDLPLEEKIEVLAHEVGHMALSLLKVPYQKLTHEPTASVLGKCLLAVIQEDFQNPLFKVGGMAELVKQFLELLKGKIDRTSLNLARMDQEYFRWKKETEGETKEEGIGR